MSLLNVKNWGEVGWGVAMAHANSMARFTRRRYRVRAYRSREHEGWSYSARPAEPR